MRLAIECRWCHRMTWINVPEAGYKKWQDGMVIQAALPDLSTSDRELLISKTCSECWDDMFDDED